MRGALMYCARTFFEKTDDQFETLVSNEITEMENESDEDEDEDDGMEEEYYGGGDEEESEDEEGEYEEGEESEEESEEESGGDGKEYCVTAEDLRLVCNVDLVVAKWCMWTPSDPVHVLIKRAIDQTPLSDD